MASAHQIVVVVMRSENGSERRKGRVILGCEVSGQYRKFKGKKAGLKANEYDNDSALQMACVETDFTSKKNGCPFQLKGTQIHVMGPWVLEVVNGMHNHSLANYLEGHAYAERLTKEEEEFVVEMSLNNVRPKNLLQQLHAKFPGNASTIKTIYNARLKNRVADRAGRTQMQYLLMKLEEHNYYYMHRRCESTGEVRELFFAHPTSIELLRAFPQVLLMDCTYKITKYKYPLMEIVGVTSTGMTFCVACAFVPAEKEENYTWVCETLRSLMDERSYPNVIVTDRDMALMNAIDRTFPQTTHLLCRWHISRNVLANCKKHMLKKAICDDFLTEWNQAMYAPSEEMFKIRLERLQSDFHKYPATVEYVLKQWVEPYGSKFAAYATNTVKHYGNQTTNWYV